MQKQVSEKKKYFVVRERAVPEVLLKVVEAKKLLDSGKVDTVQDAAERTGISRSSFYKYKDDIFPFHEETRQSPLSSRWMMNRGFCRLSCRQLHGFMETFLPFIRAFRSTELPHLL
jgi:ACT domain-containing protein